MAKKKRPHAKPNRPSDSDAGYPWGKAGKKRAKKKAPSGYTWAGHKVKKKKKKTSGRTRKKK